MSKTCNRKNSKDCIASSEPGRCARCRQPIRPEHSPIGASSCERWWNCPGSVKLMEGLPEFTGNKYTAEGTIAHMLGEQVLTALIEVERSGNDGAAIEEFPHLESEVGRSYVDEQTGIEIEVTDGMVEAVQVYIDIIDGYVKRHGLNYAQFVQAEVQFDLTHVDPEAFGTCDATIEVPMDRLIVLDYKHGQGHIVEVEDNKQLLYYGLGAYYDLPPDCRDEIVKIETAIVQPRAAHLSGQVRQHTYDIGELLTFERELKDAIHRVRSGDDTLKVGEWCKFCTAKPICPAQRQAMQDTIQMDFGKIETDRIVLPAPATLTPDRLGHLMKNAGLINDWVKSIIGLCTAVADKGTEVPGYKLVKKYGNRRWKSEKDVEDAFSLEFGESIYNKKIKSPAQMEKLLKKRKTELEPYWEVPETGTTLVAEDDARDGTPTGVAADFSAV